MVNTQIRGLARQIRPMAGNWLRQLKTNRLLTGSMVLLVSTTIVNLGNYLFNLILGRWLGPAQFADLSLIVTLMLVVTLVTATLQTVVAKFAAGYAADDDLNAIAGLRRWSYRWAWALGIVSAAGLVVGAPWLQRFFHTASAWPFILLGVGIPIYFVQGIDRGVLQGRLTFLTLATSYQAEMWVRLAVGLLLVSVGWAVNGAVAALSLSFFATWLVAQRAGASLPTGPILNVAQRRAVLRFAGPVAAALLGQILINNSDVLLVKRFFPADTAGAYAALALIGRIVFFATWSVVTVLLPSVVHRHQQGKPHAPLLWMALGLVLLVSGGIVGASLLWAEKIVGILFGPAYLAIAPLLWLYAIATTLYALSNVFITYRLAVGSGFGSGVAVVAGVAQVVALATLHNSLRQVVVVQIVLMSGLLAILIVAEFWWATTARRK